MHIHCRWITCMYLNLTLYLHIYLLHYSLHVNMFYKYIYDNTICLLNVIIHVCSITGNEIFVFCGTADFLIPFWYGYIWKTSKVFTITEYSWSILFLAIEKMAAANPVIWIIISVCSPKITCFNDK